jgi:hypothetical protein
MTSWFYRHGDSSEKGPISPSELLELVRNGLIREETFVRKGDSPWVASVDVNGLWEAAERPSAVFDCPHCGKPIAKPPVLCSHCNQTIKQATGRLVHYNTVAPRRVKGTSQSSASSNASPFGGRPGLYD